MRVESNYGKLEVEKKAKTKLFFSIVLQAVLLIVLTAIVIAIITYSFDKNNSSELDLVEVAIKENVTIRDSSFAQNLFNKCKVFYYDEDYKPLEDYTFSYSKTFDTNLNNETKTVNGKSYMIRTGKMGSNLFNAEYYMIFMDVTENREVMLAAIWLSIISFMIAIAILSTLTYWSINDQMKYYENAIEKNNQLISDISHEFNTPLAIIKVSLAKIMSEPDLKVEDASESLVSVTHEVGRLNRMVKEMLILSRSDNERLILDKTPTNITEIIKDVCEPFEIMCELDEKVMEVDLAENVESMVDQDKLRQAVIILLDNAVKYTNKGDSINVLLRDSYNKYFITVSDTGIGVSDEDIGKVFERFYRTDASRNSETGGSGLGLSIVKTITDAFGGKVMAFHNKPKGFKVVLEYPKEKFT